MTSLQKLKKFAGSVKFDHPLAELTTLKIGGKAGAFFAADSTESLVEILSFCKRMGIPYLVIGGGSNLLISDKGVEELIIQNKTVGVQIVSNTLSVKSGTVLQELVNQTIELGLSGLHHLTGIPGTLGGAIFGNAGAYGQTICDHLTSVVAFDGEKRVNLSKDACKFGYRTSIFKKNNFTILEAQFELQKGLSNALKKEADEIKEKRALRYPPGLKCPGSFFKNIPSVTLPIEVLEKIPIEKVPYGKVNAGYLLESVGSKGQHEGNIEVSNVHGNLFVNKGSGTAEDFYKLAKRLAEKVKKEFNIALEPEVQLINLPPLL